MIPKKKVMDKLKKINFHSDFNIFYSRFKEAKKDEKERKEAKEAKTLEEIREALLREYPESFENLDGQNFNWNITKDKKYYYLTFDFLFPRGNKIFHSVQRDRSDTFFKTASKVEEGKILNFNIMINWKPKVGKANLVEAGYGSYWLAELYYWLAERLSEHEKSVDAENSPF